MTWMIPAIAVKLVRAAVATAVSILAPPELFGRLQQYAAIREIETSFAETEDTVRAEPRQVRSVKLSSARESVPVRTAMPGRMLPFIEAGRGAAFGASNCTS